MKKLRIVNQKRFENAISFLLAVPVMMMLGFLFAVLFSKGYFTIIY